MIARRPHTCLESACGLSTTDWHRPMEPRRKAPPKPKPSRAKSLKHREGHRCLPPRQNPRGQHSHSCGNGPKRAPGTLGTVSRMRTRNADRELAAAAEKIDRLQDALLRAQQEFHQFALRASHDFQESSRAITIFSQLIAEQRGASEDREREYFPH